MPGTLAHTSQLGVLELSQGALNVKYFNRPAGRAFDGGTVAEMVITDSSGSELARWEGELVDASTAVNFTIDYAEHADIPAGANFALFFSFDDGYTYQWEHGRVIRQQVEWPTAPASQIENQALTFTYIPGTAVGPSWQRKTPGALKVYDNSLFSLPNALGIQNAFFDKAAAVWETPFATDSVKSVVKTIDGAGGKSSIIVCSDMSMSTYLAVQLERGLFTNKIHIMLGSGPVTMVDLVTPVDDLVHNLDVYSVIYDDATKTIGAYKGSSLTPLIDWTDEDEVVPHGPGYRYGAVSFQAAFGTAGPEFASWSMKDN